LVCYIPIWYTRPKMVTHPGTNRARHALTLFMRRTPLTTTPRRHRPCSTYYGMRTVSISPDLQLHDGITQSIKHTHTHTHVPVGVWPSVGSCVLLHACKTRWVAEQCAWRARRSHAAVCHSCAATASLTTSDYCDLPQTN